MLLQWHMCMAYSVVQHQEHFKAAYSSEPVLAEGAIQQLHQYQLQAIEKGLNIMIFTLEKVLHINNWLDLGHWGEVVMHALLMQEYMDAVLEPWDLEPIFNHGCCLITSIEWLFSLEPAGIILDGHSNNIILNTTFYKEFKNSIIWFIYWMKDGDDNMLTTKALFAAFAKGMAFICHQTQKYVNFMISILLDKSDTLQEFMMTPILSQVKRYLRQHFFQDGWTFRGNFFIESNWPQREFICWFQLFSIIFLMFCAIFSNDILAILKADWWIAIDIWRISRGLPDGI